MMRIPARHVAAILLAAAMSVFLMAAMIPAGSHSQENAVQRVSEHYLAAGVRETGAVNIVTAVLLDYRSFDTMGEAIVILAAAMAVGALLGQGRQPPAGRGLSVLVRRSIAFLVPLFWSLPAYIVVNGHLSPGGGFQGGVGWAALPIMLAVVYGAAVPARAWAHGRLPKIEYAAAFCFLGIGLFGLLHSGHFLASGAAGFPLGTPGTLPSAGAIPWLNLAIACKVMAGLSAIFFYMQRDGTLEP